jgi:hypothetical protein
MKKENLVILKGKATLVSKCGTRIEPNVPYRCVEVSESNNSEFLVFGIVFSKEAFEQLFVYIHDVIIKEFKSLNLLKQNGDIISKSAFKELAKVLKYDKGKDCYNVVFFYIHPKELTYQFLPLFKGQSKAKALAHAYKMYIDLVKGNMNDFDCHEINRGSSGIPLSYSDIYFKKEYNPENIKNELFV